eukprot:11850776-Heterocapsa_arctica.AAC.1
MFRSSFFLTIPLIALRPPKAIGKAFRRQKRTRRPRVMRNRLTKPSNHQQTTKTTKRITKRQKGH